MTAFTIPRKQVPFAKQPDWIRSFAPAHANPSTPDRVIPDVTVGDITLLNGVMVPLWDGTEMMFMTIGTPNFPNGRFPAQTLRFRQGQVVHATIGSKGGTHTLHWHGIEPTPMNDGVGHTSFEPSGHYTYQFQPNHIGTFHYHCHKNTVLHFEAGLYGLLIIDPPTGPGRTEANVPGFFGFDPATFTVPYDVEAVWVADDADPLWHQLGHDAYMAHAGVEGPFSASGILHDFNPEYFFITGFNVPGPLGGSGVVPAGLPGVDGAQIAITANVNQTVLIRTLNAAYVRTKWRLNGLDAMVVGADGRSLGVPPHGAYNAAFTQPADTFFELTTAQRWDLLIRTPALPGNFSATVEFRHYTDNQLLFTATIPITILP